MISTESWAFSFLPPFKTDVVNSFQKSLTTVKTKVDKAYKTVMDSTVIQTIIQYGEGAKEAYSFVQTVKSGSLQSILSSGELQVSKLASDFKKIDVEKSQAKDKAAQEAATLTEKTSEKTKKISENINKLREEILANPSSAATNNAQIAELTKQKDELILETNNNITNINDKLQTQLAGFDDLKANISSKLKSISEDFNPLAKDYDSTKDLQNTVKLLSPDANTKVTSNIVLAYHEIYNSLYWQDLNVVMQRVSAIRAELIADNESANSISEAAAGGLEGATSANAAAALELKKANMLALINYTELVLQKLKLDISYDLSTGGFQKINTTTAVDSFNFDNYRFDPQKEEYDVDENDLTPVASGEDIAGSITQASEPVVSAAKDDLSASEVPATTSEGENK